MISNRFWGGIIRLFGGLRSCRSRRVYSFNRFESFASQHLVSQGGKRAAVNFTLVPAIDDEIRSGLGVGEE